MNEGLADGIQSINIESYTDASNSFEFHYTSSADGPNPCPSPLNESFSLTGDNLLRKKELEYNLDVEIGNSISTILGLELRDKDLNAIFGSIDKLVHTFATHTVKLIQEFFQSKAVDAICLTKDVISTKLSHVKTIYKREKKYKGNKRTFKQNRSGQNVILLYYILYSILR